MSGIEVLQKLKLVVLKYYKTCFVIELHHMQAERLLRRALAAPSASVFVLLYQ
jgi:hypothetical protein